MLRDRLDRGGPSDRHVSRGNARRFPSVRTALSCSVLISSVAACAGQPGAMIPTAPSPVTPPAPALSATVVHVEGQLSCVGEFFFSCFVDGVGRNLGPNCARDIHGTTTLLDVAGAAIASDQWLGLKDIVRADELVAHNASYLGLTAAARGRIASWRSDFVSSPVACPAS